MVIRFNNKWAGTETVWATTDTTNLLNTNDLQCAYSMNMMRLEIRLWDQESMWWNYTLLLCLHCTGPLLAPCHQAGTCSSMMYFIAQNYTAAIQASGSKPFLSITLPRIPFTNLQKAPLAIFMMSFQHDITVCFLWVTARYTTDP